MTDKATATTTTTVGLIGLGNVGCAIANLAATNGYHVIGWEYSQEVVEEINTHHTNTRFLPDVALHPHLEATSSLERVLQSCDIVFAALPTLFIRATLEQYRGSINPQVVLVNLAKGIEPETGLTAFQLLTTLFPQNQRLMLAGPAIANEFARGAPTVVVLAGQHMPDMLRVARVLDSDTFRTRFSHDATGVELGGILKNIYTIGLGLFDGKQIHSVNIRSVYLTIALEEITRIGVTLGGNAETFSYLAGMGDLLATSLSQHSHNRRMGVLLAEGLSLDAVKAEMGVIPEGYNTMSFVLGLAEKWHVPLPLAWGLWDVLHGRRNTATFISSFARDFVV